jgi:hypothetical protein
MAKIMQVNAWIIANKLFQLDSGGVSPFSFVYSIMIHITVASVSVIK